MNKRVISVAVSFLFGGAIGSFATYFIVRDRIEKRAEEEIDSVRKVYEESIIESNYIKDKAVKMAAEIKEHGEPLSDMVENPFTRDGVLSSGTERVNYSAYYSMKDKKDNVDPLLTEHPEDDEPEDDKKVPPYKNPRIISAQAYGEKKGYDYLELIYYQGDDTLTDSNDDVIDNPEEIIGDALTKYGFKYSDEPTIYVRNDNNFTDIEITKVASAFTDCNP